MSRFNLPTLVRSALVALALGGATVGMVPAAQAAPPSIDFHFGFGGGGISIGGGRYCLGDRQVRHFLQRQGYDHIRFTGRRGHVVTVQAEKYRRDYRVSVDTCGARIVGVQRLRSHDRGHQPPRHW